MPGDERWWAQNETEDVCSEHQEALFTVKVTALQRFPERWKCLHPWRYPKQGPGLDGGFGSHDVQKPFQPLPFCNSLMSLLILMGKTHSFVQLQIDLLGNYYWPIACTVGTGPAQITCALEPCMSLAVGQVESCRWCLELSWSAAIQDYGHRYPAHLWSALFGFFPVFFWAFSHEHWPFAQENMKLVLAASEKFLIIIYVFLLKPANCQFLVLPEFGYLVLHSLAVL